MGPKPNYRFHEAAAPEKWVGELLRVFAETRSAEAEEGLKDEPLSSSERENGPENKDGAQRT